MTSINIPDMVQIVREYGLIPVPVDINLETTAPTMEDIKAVVTPKVVFYQNAQAKVFIVSYIYGIIFPIDEIADYCKEKGILLVEDAAESYYGNDYNGNSKAAMTLFSFGSIKRYTSFGGALTFVRDPEIYKKMTLMHNSFKTQTKSAFLKKLVRSLGIATVLNNQKANYSFRAASNLVNFNYKEFAVHNLRGFAPSKDFLLKFNKRPSVALLAFLYDRLKNFDLSAFKETNAKIIVTINNKLQRAKNKLVANGVLVPGYAVNERSFWLFPVLVPDLDLCAEMLNKRGVDAYLGATQLRKIMPVNEKYKLPSKMIAFFDKVEE